VLICDKREVELIME